MPQRGKEPALTLPGLAFDGGAAYPGIAIGQVEDGSLDGLLVEDTMPELTTED